MSEFVPKLVTRTSQEEPVQSGLEFVVNTVDRHEGRASFVAGMALTTSWPFNAQPRVDTFCSEAAIPSLQPRNNNNFDRAQSQSNDCGENTSYIVNTSHNVWSTNLHAGLIWGPYDDRFYVPIAVELHNSNVTRQQATEISEPESDWPEPYASDRLTTHYFDTQLRSGFLYSPEKTRVVLGAELMFLKMSLDQKKFDPNNIRLFDGIQLSAGWIL